MKRGCEVWFLLDEDYDTEYPGDRDAGDLQSEVYHLFRASKVRPSSQEDKYLACLSPEGEVLGGGVYGLYQSNKEYTEGLFDLDFDQLVFVFSVVVSPDARRRGIAEDIVKELEAAAEMEGDGYELPVKMEAEVVNPAMAKLLDKLGFRSTASSGAWSYRDPYYVKHLPW